MDDRRVKGSHINQAARWTDERLGEGRFKALTRGAGPRWGIVLPGAWYEVDVLQRALAEVASKVKMSVEDIATEIAARNADQDLTSLYRLFLRVAQPQTVLKQTPRLWSTYVNFASAKAVLNEPGHYIGRGEGFSTELVSWACGCWRGFIPTAIVKAGGKQPRGSIVKREQMKDGLHAVELEVHYD